MSMQFLQLCEHVIAVLIWRTSLVILSVILIVMVMVMSMSARLVSSFIVHVHLHAVIAIGCLAVQCSQFLSIIALQPWMGVNPNACACAVCTGVKSMSRTWCKGLSESSLS